MADKFLYQSRDRTVTKISIDGVEHRIVDGVVAVEARYRDALNQLRHRFLPIGVAERVELEPTKTEVDPKKPAGDGLDDPLPPHIEELAK